MFSKVPLEHKLELIKKNIIDISELRACLTGYLLVYIFKKNIEKLELPIIFMFIRSLAQERLPLA